MWSAAASASRLVVRDEDGADLKVENELADPVARLLAQLGVEVRQRLVEQQHARLVDERPADRDALLLTAGELIGIAFGKMAETHAVRIIWMRRPISACGHAAQLQAVADVLLDGAMRP